MMAKDKVKTKTRSKAAAGEGRVRERYDNTGKITSYDASFTGTLPNGEKKRFNIIRAKREDALAERDRVKAELAQGTFIAKNAILFKDWRHKWLYTYKINDIEPKTWEGYESSLRLYAAPSLDDKQMQEITLEDLQLIINRVAKKMAPSTVYKLYVALSACWRDAKNKGKYVKTNIVREISLPKACREKKSVKEKKPFTDDELKKIIEVAKKDPANKLNPSFFPILLTLIETGARESEILGIKKTNTNFDNCEVLLKNTLTFVSKKTREAYQDIIQPIEGTSILPKDKPKNDSSERLMPLSKTLIDLLKQLDRPGDYLFATKNGTPISQRNWIRKFDGWCEKAGIDHSTHELRHTFMTDLFDNNESLATAQYLGGYSTAQVLTKVYMHKLPESVRNAMKRRETKLDLIATNLPVATLSATNEISDKNRA